MGRKPIIRKNSIGFIGFCVSSTTITFIPFLVSSATIPSNSDNIFSLEKLSDWFWKALLEAVSILKPKLAGLIIKTVLASCIFLKSDNDFGV
jgi:hypothetical protein